MDVKTSYTLIIHKCMFFQCSGNEDFAEEKLAMMLSKDNPYLSRINKELSICY